MLLPSLAVHLFTAGHLRRHRHLLAVAADEQRNDSAGRALVQHPADLLLGANRLAVHLQHHVMYSQTSLARGRVVVHQNNLRTMSVFQLQRPQLVLRDVAQIDTQKT